MGVVSQLKIGDVDVFYDEVALGFTNGGVKVTFDRQFTDMMADQFGVAPLDKVSNGMKIKVEANMAELSKGLLSTYMPEARYDNAGADSKVGLGRDAGYSLIAGAKVLRLHPRNLPGTNQSSDIYLYKAVSAEAIELNYQIDKQDVIKITFEGLIDTTRIDGFRQGSVGDPIIS